MVIARGQQFAAQAAPTVSRAPASAGGAIIDPNAAYVDSVVREVDITAVDTWTAMVNYGATAEGAIPVPSQAKFISSIMFTSCVKALAAINTRVLTGFRLSGSGLAKGGNYRFLGNAGFLVALASGGTGNKGEVVRYPCAIPVVGANTINVESIMLGEDCGTINTSIVIVFSDKPHPSGFTDSDFREGDIANVDTDTTLVAVGTDTFGNIRVPSTQSKLAALAVAFGADFGTLTAGMMASMVFHLRGDGLKLGGTYRVLGAGQFIVANTTGGGSAVEAPEFFELNVPLVPGNTLELHAMAIAEDAGDYTAAVAVLYR